MACAPQATFNSVEGLGITLTPLASPLKIALMPPFVVVFGSSVTPNFAFFLTTILWFMSLIAPAAAAPKIVTSSAPLTVTSSAAAPATLTEMLTETLTELPQFSVTASGYQGDRAQLSPTLGVATGMMTDSVLLAKRTGTPEQRRGAGARS